MNTIAVIGQTRSGTSLTMQMLAAAGLTLPGDYPDFEDERVWMRPKGTPGWWDDYDAVKILDPHNGETWYKEGRFARRIVCVRRDIDSHAHSFNKFLEHLAGINPAPLRVLRKSIRSIRPWYVGRGKTDNSLLLYFEDTLSDPLAAARRICEFVGRGDPQEVASVVVNRTPYCYPGMLEIGLLKASEHEH